MSHLPLIIGRCLNQTNTFLKFLLVGAVNTVIGLSTIFLLMNVFEQNYWISTFVGNSVGAICSFFLNRAFTFKSRVSVKSGGVKFLVVIITCYLLSYSLSNWIAESVSGFLTKNNVAVLLGTVLYTLLNYFGQKYFVFYKRS